MSNNRERERRLVVKLQGTPSSRGNSKPGPRTLVLCLLRGARDRSEKAVNKKAGREAESPPAAKCSTKPLLLHKTFNRGNSTKILT